MNKKFKIIYYVLVALFTLIFSYQIYLLVTVILDRPQQKGAYLTAESE
jgi:hypothetical protein